jgi:hypothetical protein
MNHIPSIYAHMMSGGLLFASIIYLALNITKIMSRDPYQILLLILLFAITTSIHGISHMGLESVYKYNPLTVTLQNLRL